jgi:hypothetical protein
VWQVLEAESGDAPSSTSGQSAAADSRTAGTAHPLWAAVENCFTPPGPEELAFLRSMIHRVTQPAELTLGLPQPGAAPRPRLPAVVAREQEFAEAMRSVAAANSATSALSSAGCWQSPSAEEVAGPVTERLLAVGNPRSQQHTLSSKPFIYAHILDIAP